MSPRDVLIAVRARGVELWPAGDRLCWRGKLSPDLRAALREHKAPILAALTGACVTCGVVRPIMLAMDPAAGLPWRLCSRCHRGEGGRGTSAGAT